MEIYDNKTLKLLQRKELSILKEFVRVCEILNIQYFLIGGSLIGAVRHNGFIPWDDDIDVIMPRKDYEIFIKEGKKYIDSKYFIQNYLTEKEFTWAYTKIRDSGTTFIEPIHSNSKINQGIFIDIFPLDNYSNSFYMKNKIKLNYILINMQIAKFRIKENERKKLKTLIKEMIFAIPSKIKYGKYSIQELNEKKDYFAKLENNKKTKYMCLVLDPLLQYKYPLYKSEWFNDYVEWNFENMKVRIPAEYDRILTLRYGEYMKIPPKEEQIAKHEILKIDLENSYKNYYE